MNSKPPFANFYEDVFLAATDEQQRRFLKQLFTLDGRLCSSFLSYIGISDVEQNIIVLNNHILLAADQIKNKIKAYNWEVLYDMDPTADDYSDMLIDLLERDIISEDAYPIEAFLAQGELLQALANLRTMELGINFDWETLEEPAEFYGPEIGGNFGYQMPTFQGAFLSYVFSDDLIRQAIDFVISFKAKPGAYFNFNKEWQEIIEVMQDRLKRVA